MSASNDLTAILARHGHTAVEISGSDGGSILVADAAARVLRLTGRSGHDFLWLNKAFLEGKADELFRSPEWHNMGGDRTFIAPEPDFYITDFNDPWGTWFMPKEIDPGDYEVRLDGATVRLLSRFSLTNYRLGAQAEIEVTKSVRAAANPFHDASEDDRAFLDAEYIGYEQVSTIELLSPPSPGLRLGLWHLTQVRAPGEILMPVTDSSPPRDYLGNKGPDKFTLEPGLVRFCVDAAGMQKIGVKASSSIGRMGFVKEEDNGLLSLIVRNCLVNPSAVYIDPPWDDLDDLEYCLQCYNDDGNLGDFGEMEYHAPAVGDGTGMTSCTDISQIWAFRAERDVIQNIARRLLGIR